MATILIIEDNNEIRENTAELLSLEGFSILEAANGTEGIRMAQNSAPDLIVCDVMMPGLSGLDVLKALKQETSTSTIPFIFLSARVEKKDVQTGLELGASAYVQKPFEPTQLFEAVYRVMAK